MKLNPPEGALEDSAATDIAEQRVIGGRLNIQSGRNLATKVMSNGVEVIVKGDNTNYVDFAYEKTPVITPMPVSPRPITFPPSTVSRQFNLVAHPGKPNVIDHLLHSIVRSATPDMITKTLVTTFTFMTTVLEDMSTVVTSREQIISNVVTEKFRPSIEYTPNLKAEPSSIQPFIDESLYSSYLTNTLSTTYTYYNTFTAGSIPVVVTSKETVSNVITMPAYLITPTIADFSFQSRIFETETYFSTFTFSKTLEDESSRVITTMETITQVVVTEALIPATSSAPQITPTFTGPELKTMLTTFIDLPEAVVVDKTLINAFDSSSFKTEALLSPTLAPPTLVDIHPELREPTLSLESPSTNKLQTISLPTPTPLEPTLGESTLEIIPEFSTTRSLEPVVIFATKTYFTTFTYFTTVLGEGSSRKVHSRTQVASKIVTEALSTAFEVEYVNALKNSYLAKHSTLLEVASQVTEIIPTKTESAMLMEPTLVTQAVYHPHYPKDDDQPGILDPTTPSTGSAEHYEELKEGISHIVHVLSDTQSDDYEIVSPSQVRDPLYSTWAAPTIVSPFEVTTHDTEEDYSDSTTENTSYSPELKIKYTYSSLAHKPTPPLRTSKPTGSTTEKLTEATTEKLTEATTEKLTEATTEKRVPSTTENLVETTFSKFKDPTTKKPLRITKRPTIVKNKIISPFDDPRFSIVTGPPKSVIYDDYNEHQVTTEHPIVHLDFEDVGSYEEPSYGEMNIGDISSLVDVYVSSMYSKNQQSTKSKTATENSDGLIITPSILNKLDMFGPGGVQPGIAPSDVFITKVPANLMKGESTIDPTQQIFNMLSEITADGHLPDYYDEMKEHEAFQEHFSDETTPKFVYDISAIKSNKPTKPQLQILTTPVPGTKPPSKDTTTKSSTTTTRPVTKAATTAKPTTKAASTTKSSTKYTTTAKLSTTVTTSKPATKAGTTSKPVTKIGTTPKPVTKAGTTPKIVTKTGTTVKPVQNITTPKPTTKISDTQKSTTKVTTSPKPTTKETVTTKQSTNKLEVITTTQPTTSKSAPPRTTSEPSKSTQQNNILTSAVVSQNDPQIGTTPASRNITVFLSSLFTTPSPYSSEFQDDDDDSFEENEKDNKNMLNQFSIVNLNQPDDDDSVVVVRLTSKKPEVPKPTTRSTLRTTTPKPKRKPNDKTTKKSKKPPVIDDDDVHPSVYSLGSLDDGDGSDSEEDEDPEIFDDKSEGIDSDEAVEHPSDRHPPLSGPDNTGPSKTSLGAPVGGPGVVVNTPGGGSQIVSATQTGINWSPLLNLGAIGLGGLGASTLTKLGPLWSTMAGYMKSALPLASLARNDTHSNRNERPYNRIPHDEFMQHQHEQGNHGQPFNPMGPNFVKISSGIPPTMHMDSIPRRPILTHANEPNFRPLANREPEDNFRLENIPWPNNNFPPQNNYNFKPPHDEQPNIYTLNVNKHGNPPNSREQIPPNVKVIQGSPINAVNRPQSQSQQVSSAESVEHRLPRPPPRSQEGPGRLPWLEQVAPLQPTPSQNTKSEIHSGERLPPPPPTRNQQIRPGQNIINRPYEIIPALIDSQEVASEEHVHFSQRPRPPAGIFSNANQIHNNQQIRPAPPNNEFQSRNPQLPPQPVGTRNDNIRRPPLHHMDKVYYNNVELVGSPENPFLTISIEKTESPVPKPTPFSPPRTTTKITFSTPDGRPVEFPQGPPSHSTPFSAESMEHDLFIPPPRFPPINSMHSLPTPPPMARPITQLASNNKLTSVPPPKNNVFPGQLRPIKFEQKPAQFPFQTQLDHSGESHISLLRPQNSQQFPGPPNPQQFPGPQNSQQFPGPQNPQQFPGPQNSQQFPGPQNPQQFPGPQNSQQFPGPQNPQQFPGQQNPQQFPGPQNPQQFKGQQNPQQFPGPQNSQQFPGQQNSQQFPLPQNAFIPPMGTPTRFSPQGELRPLHQLRPTSDENASRNPPGSFEINRPINMPNQGALFPNQRNPERNGPTVLQSINRPQSANGQSRPPFLPNNNIKQNNDNNSGNKETGNTNSPAPQNPFLRPNNPGASDVSKVQSPGFGNVSAVQKPFIKPSSHEQYHPQVIRPFRPQNQGPNGPANPARPGQIFFPQANQGSQERPAGNMNRPPFLRPRPEGQDFGSFAQPQQKQPIVIQRPQGVPWPNQNQNVANSQEGTSASSEKQSIENHRVPPNYVRPSPQTPYNQRPSTIFIVHETYDVPTPAPTSTEATSEEATTKSTTEFPKLIIKEIPSTSQTTKVFPVGGFKNISASSPTTTTAKTPNKATISKLNFVRRFTTTSRPTTITVETPKSSSERVGQNSFLGSSGVPDLLNGTDEDGEENLKFGGKISSFVPKGPKFTRFPFRSTTRKPFDATKYFTNFATEDSNFGGEISGSEDTESIIDPVNEQVIKSPFDSIRPTSFNQLNDNSSVGFSSTVPSTSVITGSEEQKLLSSLTVPGGYSFSTPKEFNDLWWPTTFKPNPTTSNKNRLPIISSTHKSVDSPTTYRNTLKPTTFRPNGTLSRLPQTGAAIRNQLKRPQNTAVRYNDDTEGMSDVKLKNVEILKEGFVRPSIQEHNPFPIRGDKTSVEVNQGVPGADANERFEQDKLIESEQQYSDEYSDELETPVLDIEKEKPRRPLVSESDKIVSKDKFSQEAQKVIPTRKLGPERRPVLPIREEEPDESNETDSDKMPYPSTRLRPPAPPPGYNLNPSNPQIRPAGFIHPGNRPGPQNQGRPLRTRPDFFPKPPNAPGPPSPQNHGLIRRPFPSNPQIVGPQGQPLIPLSPIPQPPQQPQRQPGRQPIAPQHPIRRPGGPGSSVPFNRPFLRPIPNRENNNQNNRPNQENLGRPTQNNLNRQNQGNVNRPTTDGNDRTNIIRTRPTMIPLREESTTQRLTTSTAGSSITSQEYSDENESNEIIIDTVRSTTPSESSLIIQNQQKSTTEESKPQGQPQSSPKPLDSVPAADGDVSSEEYYEEEELSKERDTEVPASQKPPESNPKEWPQRGPEQSSQPQRQPEQSSASQRPPERSSEPQQRPEQPSGPQRRPEQPSDSHRRPEQPSDSNRRPDQSPESQRRPDQSSESQRRPEQPSEPQRRPEQPSEPQRRPEQPSDSHRRPEQPSDSNRRPDQSPESQRRPDQSSESQRRPEQPSEPQRRPEQPSEPQRRPEQPSENQRRPEQPSEPQRRPEPPRRRPQNAPASAEQTPSNRPIHAGGHLSNDQRFQRPNPNLVRPGIPRFPITHTQQRPQPSPSNQRPFVFTGRPLPPNPEMQPPAPQNVRPRPPVLDLPSAGPIRYRPRQPVRPNLRPNLLRPDDELFKATKLESKPQVTLHTIASVDDDNKIVATNVFTAILPSREIIRSKYLSEEQASANLEGSPNNLHTLSPSLEGGESGIRPTSVIKYSSGSLQTVSTSPSSTLTSSEDYASEEDEFEEEEEEDEPQIITSARVPIRPTRTFSRTVIRTVIKSTISKSKSSESSIEATPTVSPSSALEATQAPESLPSQPPSPQPTTVSSTESENRNTTSNETRTTLPSRRPFTRPTSTVASTTTESVNEIIPPESPTSDPVKVESSKKPYVPARNSTFGAFPPWRRFTTTTEKLEEETEVTEGSSSIPSSTRRYITRRPFVPSSTKVPLSPTNDAKANNNGGFLRPNRPTTFRPFKRPSQNEISSTVSSSTAEDEGSDEENDKDTSENNQVNVVGKSPTLEPSSTTTTAAGTNTDKTREEVTVVTNVQSSIYISPTRSINRGKFRVTSGSSASTPILPAGKYSTRFITHTETQTQTITETETTVMSSSGHPMTHTIMITKTLPPQTLISTIVGTVTVVNSVEVKPTTVRTTIFAEPTIIIPSFKETTEHTNRDQDMIDRRITHANIITATSASNGRHRPRLPSSTPTASLTTETAVMDNQVNANSPAIECTTTCGFKGNHQICRKYANGTRSHCVCAPGFARLKPTMSCKPTFTYEMSIAVNQMRGMSFDVKDLNNEASESYQNFSKAAKDALDRTFMYTDVRSKFMGAEIMKIVPKQMKDMNLNLSENKFGLDFLVQLSLNVSEDLLKSQFIRQLRASNFSVGRTGMTTTNNISDFAARDFDECSHPDYNDCSKDADCINIKGSYSCECQSGFMDTSKKNAPGRECKAVDGCVECNYNGRCIIDQFGNAGCHCFRWFGGAECQINLKILLISIIVIGLVLFILVLLCGVIVCRRKKPTPHLRERTGSGRFLRYRSPTSQATLERAAIMHDSGSSDGSQTPPSRMNHHTHSFTPDSLLMENSDKGLPRSSRDVNLMNFSLRNVIMDQQDRSLTVVIPRAKIRPTSRPPSRPNQTTATLGPDANSDLATTEQKLISYLDQGAFSGQANRPGAASRQSAGQNKPEGRNFRKFSLQEQRKISSGALVSSGTEVSALGGMRRKSTGLPVQDGESTFRGSVSEVRSFDETIRSPGKPVSVDQNSRGSCYSCKPPSFCAYSESHGHTMAEKDGASTVYTTQGKLFRTSQDSDSNSLSD
ncbi:unnamed protein product [Allacma fusca]|uniref:EGF-like domain-containing protein n=1 Tax=Allacma fusca TaxID=39272 RepID=A0A8J2LF11_9HEXA|nr:unnamed protein product [Allacma fusca]